MVVNDLDIDRPSLAPPKADPPLIIDADRILPGSGPAQLLQAIARRIQQVFELIGRIMRAQLAPSSILQAGRKPAAPLSVPQTLGIAINETEDHDRSA
jgi:hypothetical protein